MRLPLTVVLVSTLFPTPARAGSPWVSQPGGTTERLRGVASVDDRVVWAVGNHATCIRSLDGGATWTKVAVPDDAGDLDFRDVEAMDGERAYVLAIGPGAKSRVFKATAHGAMLVECYRNPDPRQFLDAIAFWDHDHGIALSDPVDGRFVIMGTDDAGRSWEQRSAEGTMPPSLPDEGAFAASGTCLVAGPGRRAWFATGGGAMARVFRTEDAGRSWTATTTPVAAGGPTKGIFGLAFRDDRRGVAVGGDYKALDESAANSALTETGGNSWPLMPTTRPSGFRSAVAWLPTPGRPATTLLAIGPGGTDLGEGEGARWRPIAGGDGFHALAVAPSGRFAWAVGEGGKVGRLAVAEIPPTPAKP